MSLTLSAAQAKQRALDECARGAHQRDLITGTVSWGTIWKTGKHGEKPVGYRKSRITLIERVVMADIPFLFLTPPFMTFFGVWGTYEVQAAKEVMRLSRSSVAKVQNQMPLQVRTARFEVQREATRLFKGLIGEVIAVERFAGILYRLQHRHNDLATEVRRSREEWRIRFLRHWVLTHLSVSTKRWHKQLCDEALNLAQNVQYSPGRLGDLRQHRKRTVELLKANAILIRVGG